MPNSQVPSIFLNQDGTISIQVDVYDFDAGTPVEITGQATQENGAVASFYSVQDVPAHADGQSASISVRSVPVVAPNEFVPGFPVTITVKAALAWTVEMDPIPAGRLQNIEPAPKGGWKSDSFGAAVQPLAPVAPPAQLRHGKWWDGVKRAGGRFHARWDVRARRADQRRAGPRALLGGRGVTPRPPSAASQPACGSRPVSTPACLRRGPEGPACPRP